MAPLKALLVVLILTLCGNAGAQVIAPVKVTPAKVRTISETVEGNGVLQPYPQDNVKVSAVSPMRIEAILVRPGDRVQKGQLVLRLQRDHAVDMAVEKEKITLAQAQINSIRAKKLFENGVIPRVKFEQAQTEFKLAKADLEIRKRALEYAIKNSAIRSPIRGIVASVNGDVGQIAGPSQTIIRIVNLRKMIALIGIEIEDNEKINVGERAVITIPNLPNGNVFEGEVIKLNKEIDPATQLVHIWIAIPNKRRFLQPGMFGAARIFVKSERNTIVVPSSAVLKDDKGPYLYVVEKGTAHKIYVKKGIQTDEYVQILKGLKKQQPVVVKGNYELKDGMRVRIQE